MKQENKRKKKRVKEIISNTGSTEGKNTENNHVFEVEDYSSEGFISDVVCSFKLKTIDSEGAGPNKSSQPDKTADGKIGTPEKKLAYGG